MSNKEEYLQTILTEIEERRGRHKRGLFRINEKIPDEYAQHIKKHFEGNPYYDVELRKCASCLHTWDIYIYFKNLPS